MTGNRTTRTDGRRNRWLTRRGYLYGSLLAGLGAATGTTTGAASGPALAAATVPLDHRWRRVDLSGDHVEPVVVAGPLSDEGGYPAPPRLRDVSGAGFDCRIAEWRYLDDWHVVEDVGFVAVDAGAWRLADGTRLAAGTVETDHGFARATFDSPFETAPVVFSHVQTRKGGDPVVTRNRHRSTDGVSIRLQEEEAEGPHVTERVGYLAVEPGTGTLSGRPFEAGVATADHRWTRVEFAGRYEEPVLVADLQAMNGWNTCGLRHRNLTGSGVELFVEEERSADQEVGHVAERVGYLVVEGAEDGGSGGGGGGGGDGGDDDGTGQTDGGSPVERIVGYYTGWSRYGRDYLPSDVPLDRLTHVNYAFMDAQSDGRVTFYDDQADPVNLAAFRDLKRSHPDTKMLLSIGGWTLSDDFSDAAATAERRARFASTTLDLLREYDFDGVDVDWEYPGGGGMDGNTVREEDPDNFVRLLTELRRQLDAAGRADGKEYLLSIAVSAATAKIDPLDVPAIAEHVDHVNVMTYDFGGPWSPHTNFNTPLYPSSTDPMSPGWREQACADHGMRYWAEKGMPRRKLTLGLAFYARAFAGVPNRNDGLYQPFEDAPDLDWFDPGVTDLQYVQRLLDTDPSYERHWHEETQVPWVYSPEDGVFVSYEDPESIGVKTRYAEAQGFGGLFFWECYGDREERLLDSIHETLAADPSQ